MSFLVPLCAQILLVESWTDAIVDQILFEGYKMYLNTFERQIIPDTDTLCLIICLTQLALCLLMLKETACRYQEMMICKL